jgi:hypothetical protein
LICAQPLEPPRPDYQQRRHEDGEPGPDDRDPEATRHARRPAHGGALEPDAIDADRLGDVLDPVTAAIAEIKIELVADLIVDRAGNRDAAGGG